MFSSRTLWRPRNWLWIAGKWFFNKCLIVPNGANFIPELNTLDDHLKFATLDCIISVWQKRALSTSEFTCQVAIAECCKWLHFTTKAIFSSIENSEKLLTLIWNLKLSPCTAFHSHCIMNSPPNLEHNWQLIELSPQPTASQSNNLQLFKSRLPQKVEM